MNKPHRLLLLMAAMLIATGALAEPQDSFRGLTGPWTTDSPHRFAELSWLAAQSVGEPATSTRTAAPDLGTESPPWYTRNSIHKYLGLGSLAAAGLTFASPKTESGPHAFFARAATGLGVAAVATGLIAHWDDLDANWRNPDTQHALLGTLAALGFLAAVSRGGKEGHAGFGELGALSMIVAIKLVW